MRIAFGVTFVEHGTQKLFSFPLEPVGGLSPGLLLFVGLLETIGGSLVTLGLFTRIAAFLAPAKWRWAIGGCMLPRASIPS
jgi:putative oxidoreductase